MTRKALALAVLALVPTLGLADEWDVSTNDDNGNTTGNVLFHGSEQLHDLARTPANLPDQDWYNVLSRPFSSYQVVIDGMTGDLDLASNDLQLLLPPGTTTVASALVTDGGGGLRLQWANSTAAPVAHFVRVMGAACGTACTVPDNYRIRFYDTTYTIPRFNNSGTQLTTLVVQNATERDCAVAYVLLDAAGAQVAATQRPLAARGVDVVSAAALAPNQSGSVRIAHTCGFGGLSGKAVSVEPATGFTFDTAMDHRPH
jgi:hypothetical protein